MTEKPPAPAQDIEQLKSLWQKVCPRIEEEIGRQRASSAPAPAAGSLYKDDKRPVQS